ncbi:GNAT family N-acetyltransferase [Rugamonas sp. CCM 8940]|uniref:GNAT family N-acetyltransferase n=1 Tax=Rugamonas sp. CCM 8940 TaxID=2765359 RepID=UPI0018F37A36|nr:GNAT family N-acetyltransferase [Rugamonas sp. CCM 8940]MBJ7310374.1 GNAT family N-acetyltransferase [Rugamonas sp. CCM 8940]
MDTITLTPAMPGHQAFLLALYTGTREDLAGLDCDGEGLQNLVRLQFKAQQQYYQAQFPLAAAQLVLLDDSPVGRIIVERGATELRLVDICLLPGFQRRGIGQRLLRLLMEQAAQAALPLRLSVLLDNPAQHLYQRLGFVAGAVAGIHLSMEWRGEQAQQTDAAVAGRSSG